MKYLILFFSLLTISSIGQAQSVDWMEKNDEELAIQFYHEGSYEKARTLFEDLVKKQHSDNVATYYLNCLLKLQDYKEAESYLKKRGKQLENPWVNQVDLAFVYKEADKIKDAKKTLDHLFKEMPKEVLLTQTISSALERRAFVQEAIDCYLMVRKARNSKALFAIELAQLYEGRGETADMLGEYLLYLEQDPKHIEEIKTSLAISLENESSYDLIKNTLIKKIQSQPENPYLTELLSWAFITKKEFFSALIQLKALDRRMKGNGYQVFQLAKICVQNKAYKEAASAYEYLLDKEDKGPYYFQSKLGFIHMKYLQVTENGNYEQADLVALESDYNVFVNDPSVPFGEKYRGYRRLAEIQALYLGKMDVAIKSLTNLLESSQIPPIIKGELKLDLADYLLMQGNLWDAKLRYWQVEKDFKDNTLSHKAKYMKAKISFYQGEFELSQNFLKVLKGSTSELIANDALQLSMTIQDNYGLDTISTPLELFATADKFLFMNKLEDANLTLDTILNFFPNHTLDDDIYYLKGKIYAKSQQWEKSISYYSKVFTDYGDDILADDAYYQAAITYQEKLGKDYEAFQLLEKLVLNYQGSVFAVDARERYRILREDNPDFVNRSSDQPTENP